MEDNKRKLVTIRQISQLEAIPGADFIECATVDGWELVVKKGEFKEKDLCVFFEIDSFLPKVPVFEFLGKTITHQGKEGYRLKTIRLRKQISQGLALPMKSLESFMDHKSWSKLKIGDEVTEQVGVIKYDIDLSKGNKGGLKTGNAGGKFPEFIPKTDQERIQNRVKLFSTNEDIEYEESLKLDGSSMTCYRYKGKSKWYDPILRFFKIRIDRTYFGVCSRNLEIKRDTKSDFWGAAIKFKIEEELPYGYAIQGELCGPKIQSNHEKLDQNHYYVYDVFDIINQRYLSPEERRFFIDNMTVDHVPIINKRVKIFKECKDIKDILSRVEGQSIMKGTISEGRVYKRLGNNGGNNKHSFKAISNKYLLKTGK